MQKLLEHLIIRRKLAFLFYSFPVVLYWLAFA